MKNLLEKSRTLNKLLQKASGHPVEFTEMARVLGDLINANIYVTGINGKLLGYSFMDDFGCPALEHFFASNTALTESHNESLLRVPQTALNLSNEKRDCVLDEIGNDGCNYDGKVTTIVPIIVSGQRQGTLVLTKFNKEEFDYEDTILAEYGAMVIGMEILRARSEKIEEEARQKAAVQIAIGTLSYSEQEAIEHIFRELHGKEALLVASKIADRVGITRSVIVNALRKFESAGVIETKSLGMKGTYIRVLNDNLLEELEKRRRDR
ncbi:MAG: GTP-sensing pleiotropic transcriptional regulator CodY [Peptococcaceae bacterium]|nr:GTP-sensing pleiotropic transcriptional regulator CodY [Peptococcaceae bacterium]